MPRDDEGKDWNNAAASQGMPKTADEPPQAEKRQRRALLWIQRMALLTPSFRTPDLQKRKAIIFIVLSHPVCGILLRQP